MTEFINEFGKTNFIILTSIIAVVILALIIILIIENKANKKYEEIEDYNGPTDYDENHINIETPIEDESDKIYYVDHEPTKEEAKEKLEEVTRKLVEDDLNLINHTSFEKEQEEKSIISYDELVEASNSYEDNDRYMLDEEESAITLDELYRKHEEDQIDINQKIDNPIFEDDNKRFRNSDVISPVFGIYKGETKQTKKLEPAKDLEEEIRKTEEFLEQLRKLKSKLQ